MKRYLTPDNLPFLSLCGGLLTFIMRLWLMILGEDERGLLSSGSFPDVMSWILVAVTMAAILLSVKDMRGGAKYRYNFPPSLLAAISMLLAAVSFVITSVGELITNTDAVGTAGSILGFFAAASLVLLAWFRFKGQRLNVLFYGVICVYLMLYLVSHYRLWSSYPQLQSYAFELLAIVFVMLACYHRAAFDAGKGNRRAYTFFTSAALFFCIATLPGCENMTFFLGCAVWMYFTPCRLRHSSRKEG